jgi:hypothetical protein
MRIAQESKCCSANGCPPGFCSFLVIGQDFLAIPTVTVRVNCPFVYGVCVRLVGLMLLRRARDISCRSRRCLWTARVWPWRHKEHSVSAGTPVSFRTLPETLAMTASEPKAWTMIAFDPRIRLPSRRCLLRQIDFRSVRAFAKAAATAVTAVQATRRRPEPTAVRYAVGLINATADRC